MDPLSTYLPNFSCHFLPLWKIFQFKCTAAQLNLVHPQSKFPIFPFNFAFLIFIFFAKFATSCPVCDGYPSIGRIKQACKWFIGFRSGLQKRPKWQGKRVSESGWLRAQPTAIRRTFTHVRPVNDPTLWLRGGDIVVTGFYDRIVLCQMIEGKT